MHRCSLPYIGRGIADRSIRDHHARRQAAPPQRVLTILPPVTALAVGLPAQRAIAQRFRALTQIGSGTAVTLALWASSLIPPQISKSRIRNQTRNHDLTVSLLCLPYFYIDTV